jgi:hypothetical protein
VQSVYKEENWGDAVSCQLTGSSAREAVKVGFESRKLKNLHVRSRCQGTADKDTAGRIKLAGAVVSCEMCRSAIALQLLVFPSSVSGQ